MTAKANQPLNQAMNTFKKTMMITFVAALIGAVISSWVSPSAIAWYFDPPTDIGVNCRSAVEWALHKFQMAQVFGLAGGAILGLFVAIVLTTKNQPRI